MPRRAAPATWSSMSEMSGETTSVARGCSSAGIWKQTDLPKPVGSTARVSRPLSTASTTRDCAGRKSS